MLPLCSAPLSDPEPTQELWSKIKQTLCSLQSENAARYRREMFLRVCQRCCTAACVYACVCFCVLMLVNLYVGLKAAKLKDIYIFTIQSCICVFHVLRFTAPVHEAYISGAVFFFCLWWINRTFCECVRVWINLAGCQVCAVIIGWLWKLLHKHSLAPNIKQEKQGQSESVCVGVQSYKEHKKCHHDWSWEDNFSFLFSFIDLKPRQRYPMIP